MLFLSLRELLQQGLQHPSGSLERQRALSLLVGRMQASGQIWVDERVDPDAYAEALSHALLDFCHSPESYLVSQEDVVIRFNQTLRQSLAAGQI